MGVKGLWRLLDGTGRPLNLESLEGKVLAVDISVWLNMAIKGMRDYQGHAMANAHLATLFNRICKLLYYGVKPVFVFDGQAPMLKQKTLRERREKKQFHAKESKKASEKILQNYLKKQILQEAVGKSSQEEISSADPNHQVKKSNKMKVNKEHEADIYELPTLSSQLIDSDQEDLEEELKMRTELQNEYIDDSVHVDVAGILNMNIESKDFAALPTDVQYELLKDLKEVRKKRRTALEAMPEESNSFSDYQIAGLLAKRKISKKMESVENKMSEENLASSSVYAGFSSDIFETHKVDARQLVSDSSTHYVWMRKLDDKKNQIGNTKEIPGKLLPTIEEESPKKDTQLNHQEFEATVPEILNIVPMAKSSDESIPTYSNTQTEHTADKNNDSISSFEANQEFKKLGVEDQSPSTSYIYNNGNEIKNENSILKLDNHNSDMKIVDKNDAPTNDEITKDAIIEVKSPEEPKIKQISDDDNIVTVSHTEQVDIIKGTDSIDNMDVEVTQSGTEVISSEESKEKFQRNIAYDNILPIAHTVPAENQTISSEVKDVVNLTPNFNPLSEASEKIEAEALVESSDSDDDEFVEVTGKEQEIKKPEEETEMPKTHEKMKASESISEPEIVSEVNPWEGLNADNIDNFVEQLDSEGRELKNMMQAKERAARDLSQTAQIECQELLKLFGLPYVLSPQEAEAQCAALELLGLTDGTITEDSDIWLFGGKFVIKDMFGSKRDPVAYNSNDIEMQLGLNRDRFICVALCTGSDYTTGLHGVGPVTAMEILREFSGEGLEGLMKLRSWWDEVCANAKQTVALETKIKSQLRKINLKKDFPSQVIYKAYTQPIVDETNTKFQWGFPDLDELRNFAINTIGWTKLKVNEILIPVMKKLGQQRSSQKKITQFLPVVFSQNTKKKKSKRIMRSIVALTGQADPAESAVAKKKPRRNTKSKRKGEVKKETELKLSESSSEDDN